MGGGWEWGGGGEDGDGGGGGWRGNVDGRAACAVRRYTPKPPPSRRTPPHPIVRILRATDALQSFRPAASASFSHFQLDVSRELKLLTDLAFIKGCGCC